MKVTIISVGKPSVSEYKQMADDYQKRLSHDVQVEWKFLSASASQDATTCRNDESERIIKLLKPTDNIILLDERGVLYDNPALANIIGDFSGRHGRMIFIIGGAFGVNDALRKQADIVWSLSKLVFPHQLVRILLLEQLYRTTAVQKGHPYHHT